MRNIIGIVPPAKLYEDDIPHRDLYLFANPYARRMARHALPVGVLPVDAHVAEEALALYDAFLIAGGNKIWPYHLQVIDHALRLRKPVLGICLGMQAIAAYFQVRARQAATSEGLLECFSAMKREGFLFNLPVEHHALENVTRSGLDGARHPVLLRPGSRLHQAAGADRAEAVSLHAYRIAPPAPGLAVTATAPDGVIEGIEHGGFLVGAQFHPEVDDGWDALFAAFAAGEWAAPLHPQQPPEPPCPII